MKTVRWLWAVLALIALPAIAQSTFKFSQGQSGSESPLDADSRVANHFNRLSTPHPFDDNLDYFKSRTYRMQEALRLKNFDDPVFTEEVYSFDAAITLYQQGQLPVYSFLDAYDVIQWQQLVNGTYETEAGMTGASLEFKQFKSADDPVFIQYLKNSPSSASLLERKESIFQSLQNIQPLFHYTTVELTPPVAEALKTMGIKIKTGTEDDESDEDEDEDKDDTEKNVPEVNKKIASSFAQYLKTLVEEGINIAMVDDLQAPSRLYLPSWELFNFMQIEWTHYHAIHSIDKKDWSPTKAIPSLGTLARLDVRGHRGLNMHPVQLYHPHTSNLLFPHTLYAGTLTGRHDMYHLLVLGFWPKKDKQTLHYTHDSLDHMQKLMRKAVSENRPVLDNLEPEFKTGLQKLFDEWLPGKKLNIVQQQNTLPVLLKTNWDFKRFNTRIEDILDQASPDYIHANTAVKKRVVYMELLNDLLNLEDDISLEELVELNYYLYRTIRQFEPVRHDRIADINPLINSIELFQNAALNLYEEQRPDPADLFSISDISYYLGSDSPASEYSENEMLRQLYRFWESYLAPNGPCKPADRDSLCQRD